MSEDTQQVDMALILEGRIKERVDAALKPMLEKMVVNVIGREFSRYMDEHKKQMMMEITTTMGKVIAIAQTENRKPLWESTPEEFGFTQAALSTHMMGVEVDEHTHK